MLDYVVHTDVHSYTNLLNAYVRCGDITGAEGVWVSMLQAPLTQPSASVITPNVVTCTTLIKGYCEGSQVSKAQALFLRMLSQSNADISDITSPSTASNSTTTTEATTNTSSTSSKSKKAKHGASSTPKLPLPNTRTLNTLLRGCIRCGEVSIAHEVFAAVSKVEASHGIDLVDETSLEYCIALYCQSLNIDAAEKLHEYFMQSYGVPSTTAEESQEVQPHTQSQLSAIYVSLSRAHALAGNYATSENYESLARTTIKKAKSNILLVAMKATAAKDKGESGKESGNNSTSALFQQHRYAELMRDCDLIHQYNGSVRESETPHGDDESSTRMKNTVNCLTKVLLFNELTKSNTDCAITKCVESDSIIVNGKRKEPDSDVTNEWFNTLKECMVRNLLEKFGLEQLCQLISQQDGGDGNVRFLKSQAMNTIIRNTSENAETGVGTASSCCIRFDRLLQLCSDFESMNKQAKKGLDSLLDENLQVKLEIGSGSGEWVVQQAISDYKRQADNGEKQQKVIWVSLEQVLMCLIFFLYRHLV